jgi:hypothetical protein
METIGRYYIDAIRRVQPRGPYYLGGYCIRSCRIRNGAATPHGQGRSSLLGSA